MTFTMSTEGDSVKSALSEANDKNATDNHTDDSSQDSVDAKEAQADKPIGNNLNASKEEKSKEESTEGESDQESETSLVEKKEDDDADANKSEEKVKENDAKSDDVKEEEEKEEVKSEEEQQKEKPKKGEEKSGKKAKAAKAAKKADDEEEDDEEEEEEEEDEEGDKKKGVPLLDQPLETSGKRERKNVQRFEEDSAKKDPPKIEFEEGSGTALGEIPRVEATIGRFKGEDLKLLHKVLFKVTGKHTFYKKNIRKFNGFAFEKDSDEYNKKVEGLKKNDVKHLKTICEILDLNKNGNKEEIVEKIMDFLMEPKDSGKPVGGTGRPKRASAVRANNRGYSSHDDYSSDERHAARARRDKGKRANLKDDSSSDEEFKPGNVSEGSDEKPKSVGKRKRGRPKKGSSEEDEASLSGATSDESDDVPKSKRRRSVGKANSRVKKTPGKRGRPSKAAAAASATPKRSGRGRKAANDGARSSDESEKAGNANDESSSSEDEPLVKKKAKTSEPPTDDEIKTFIKSVLEGANLEEITMKTVCQRVYDNYPDFDLTARKNFIKSTVKSLIAT